MKVFRIVRKHYEILGIMSSSNLSIQKYSFTKRAFGLLSVGCLTVSQLVYIFCVANGFFEYMEAICAASVTILIFVCIASIVFKSSLLIEHYEKMEKLIGTSKRQVTRHVQMI